MTITLISCDGRDRIHKINAEVLHEGNLLNVFSQQIKFIPEQPIIIATDTILKNGFQIKIKYNSLENHDIVKIVKNKKNTITKVHYKNFEAKIEVLKDGNIINKSSISKALFNKFQNPDFWTKAIMQYVWIDYEASAKSNIYLNTSFHIPNTDTFKDFILKIDKNGMMQINQRNLTKNII
ncbi:DUF4738 domain-containing protein [Flaviramulus aquimarinus]|uniref:DUF4738 domain-containing protein n=1 Tax=Flaviramulus aquimarinus TaxID=1170456 RepID=UPI0031EBF9FE